MGMTEEDRAEEEAAVELRQLVRVPPVTCPPGTTLGDAARLIDARGVGCLLVVDEHGHLVGLVTDRDIVVRGVARDLALGATVADVMSPDVVWVPDTTDVLEVATRMATTGFRRVPALDAEGRLVGLVALDDLAVLLARELDKLARVIGAESAGAGEEPLPAERTGGP